MVSSLFAALIMCDLATARPSKNTTRPGSSPTPECGDSFSVTGRHGGKQLLVPTGWKSKEGFESVLVEDDELVPRLGARAYFADTCTAGVYNNTDYMRMNLLGKALRFSADLRGAGCGCNAAFYLTSMGHNKKASECFDHYCDANNVCGQSCSEIDIMEANQHAWHSTLHTATDADGAASGFGGGGAGWNGPRNWTAEDYGVGGRCIDTSEAFQVVASFPVDATGSLVAMQVTLSQRGRPCDLHARVGGYSQGIKELTSALSDGMTPIVSYWADPDMTWLDGPGEDGRGSCTKDSVRNCAQSVRLSGFAVEDLSHGQEAELQRAAEEQDRDMAERYPKPSGTQSDKQWPSQEQWAGSAEGAQSAASPWDSGSSQGAQSPPAPEEQRADPAAGGDGWQSSSQEQSEERQSSSSPGDAGSTQAVQNPPAESESLPEGGYFTTKEHIKVAMQKSEHLRSGLRHAKPPPRNTWLVLAVITLCGMLLVALRRFVPSGEHRASTEPAPAPPAPAAPARRTSVRQLLYAAWPLQGKLPQLTEATAPGGGQTLRTQLASSQSLLGLLGVPRELAA